MGPNDSAFVIGINRLFHKGPPMHKLNPFDDRTFVVQTASVPFGQKGMSDLSLVEAVQ